MNAIAVWRQEKHMNGNRIAPGALPGGRRTTARTNLCARPAAGRLDRRASGRRAVWHLPNPLREALKVLASEGLVTLKPRRGCYVTEISERDLDEIFSVMALLEGQCAADTARKAGSGDLRALQALHDKLEAAAERGDIEGFFESNQLFHAKVQEIADNRWLEQVIGDLRKVIKLAPPFAFQRRPTRAIAHRASPHSRSLRRA